MVNLNNYSTRKDVESNIFEFIEVFYNKRRLHSYLDYLSPEEFEMDFINEFNTNAAQLNVHFL